MNSRIRKLAVLFLAVAVTAGPLTVITSDIADARRGGGHGGGHHGHHSGHYKKPRPGYHGGGTQHHHHHHDWDYDHHHHNHYGRWAAATVTAAAIGSIIYSVPCGTTVVRNGRTYYRCGGVWYRPRYQGSNVTYVVVSAP